MEGEIWPRGNRPGAHEVKSPELGRIWFVTCDATARIKQLSQTLTDTLSILQGRQLLFEIVEQRLAEHDDDVVREIAATGVVQLASRPIRDEEEGTIILTPVGTGGPAQVDWPAFDDWLTQYLCSDRLADVRLKLSLTAAAERHIFVATSMSTPWIVHYALSYDHRQLPPDNPRLPAEITHLWLWDQPAGRCVAWFPERGWLHPDRHWATP